MSVPPVLFGSIGVSGWPAKCCWTARAPGMSAATVSNAIRSVQPSPRSSLLSVSGPGRGSGAGGQLLVAAARLRP
ncbi:hypothetical protein [Streptomyces sp. NPDC006335]|uniref:hypothetical protein n=1 Tax=Streptomyces sp. NPDC006335 TaxID=3156895 RepID=UPI0033BB0D61